MSKTMRMGDARDYRRVIHVPRRFVCEEWGGTETVVLETCRRQQLAGTTPAIYTSMALATQKHEVIQDVPVRRFRHCYPFFGLSASDKLALDRKGGNLLSLSLFAGLLTAPNVRLFHAHTLKRVGGTVRTAARLRRKPFVVSLHGGVFDVPAAESESLVKPIQGKWEWGKPFGALFGSRRVLDDADLVLCVGMTEYEKARRHLSHDRVAHLPNGVDCAKFAHGDGAAFRASRNIPSSGFLVLNVSRIDEQKNQMLLVRAFAQNGEAGPLCPSCSHRTGNDAGLCRPDSGVCSAEWFGLRVHLLPGLKNTDPALVNAYHACDLFVLPSAHEPFGIVVLEAWSAGKSVIASRVGGLTTLVTADHTGLFIQSGDEEDLFTKMQALAENAELRGRLGEGGRAEVTRHYDWTSIAARQELLYQQAEQNTHMRRKGGAT